MTETLPNGWANAAIGELGKEVRGQVRPETGTEYYLYSVPTFPTGRPEKVDGGHIKSGKRQVRGGDVLLCKINPRINRVWIVGQSEGLPQIASTEYLVLRPHQTRMGRYIRHYLTSPLFRDWIKMSVEGATGSHTRAKSRPILEQQMQVPPLAEQERIVAVLDGHLSRIDTALTHVKIVREKAAQFRRSLLHAAFTGALTGHDPSTGDPPPAVGHGQRLGSLGRRFEDKFVPKLAPSTTCTAFRHFPRGAQRRSMVVISRVGNVRFGEATYCCARSTRESTECGSLGSPKDCLRLHLRSIWFSDHTKLAWGVTSATI